MPNGKGRGIWFIPRTTRGKVAMVIWIIFFALVQYPLVTLAAGKLHPYVFGLPFNFFYWWIMFLILIFLEIIFAWRIWETKEE
jgi:hypothetical protein